MMPGEFYEWLNDSVHPMVLDWWIMAEERKWWVLGAVGLNVGAIWLWAVWQRKKRIASAG